MTFDEYKKLATVMSQKIIVVQCPEHSGTMHTVRFAKKYGKKIFAVTYLMEKSVQIAPCRRKKIDPLVKIRLTPKKSWRRGSI